MTRITVPPEAAEAARRLHNAGFAAVVVGGAVRDSLLGRPAKDWDLATAATPEQVLRVFPHASVTTRFGTTLVPSALGLLEITTFRSEADYADYRRPSTVAFTTDLAQDLSRRDFTVNALAYDPVTDTIIDLFGGESDLAARRLRAVGVAEDRFGEDALRLLRAIRFVATLGFTLDPATAKAAARQASLTRHLAPERVGTELVRLVAAPHAGAALLEAARLGLLDAFFPSLAAPTGSLRHGALALDALGVHAHPVERLAALTHYARTAPAEASRAVFDCLMALALGEDIARDVAALIAATGLSTDLRGPDLAKAMRPWSETELAAAFRIRSACERAVSGGQKPAVLTLGVEAQRVLALGLPRSIAELVIGGDDLVALGLRPGPRFGAILRELLDAITEGRLANHREQLLAAARELASN